MWYRANRRKRRRERRSCEGSSSCRLLSFYLDACVVDTQGVVRGLSWPSRLSAVGLGLYVSMQRTLQIFRLLIVCCSGLRNTRSNQAPLAELQAANKLSWHPTSAPPPSQRNSSTNPQHISTTLNHNPTIHPPKNEGLPSPPKPDLPKPDLHSTLHTNTITTTDPRNAIRNPHQPRSPHPSHHAPFHLGVSK